MAHPILMPKPGQMTEECVLVAWHKREGDPIRKGDLLFEIETDKSNMDVESFEDGVLLKRTVAEGETAQVNSVCGYIGAAGESVPDATPSSRPAASSLPAEPGPTPVGADVSQAGGAADAPSRHGGSRDRLRISPRAARLAAELSVDPRAIAGSGPGGRVVERDVRAAASTGTRGTSGPVAPLAEAAAPEAAEGAEAPRPLSRMRRVIAERLTLSATTVPQFNVTVGVDMTRLLALRAQLRLDGTVVTVTDLVVSAVAHTLVEFPDVNARTDGLSVWPRARVHVGLAVSLPDGLVVPVIHDADRRSLAAIHAVAAQLADAARGGRLLPDDMTGGTFTISNLGMHGVEEFSAIINPGESAILAVSSILATPVALANGIAVRHVMKMTLTADHRLVDGELAARFLNAVRRRLEDPGGFRLDLLNH
jgi:pyruvate dehydrogenase E2 component (dihydrolipoamide acetyltransferase)